MGASYPSDSYMNFVNVIISVDNIKDIRKNLDSYPGESIVKKKNSIILV